MVYPMDYYGREGLGRVRAENVDIEATGTLEKEMEALSVSAAA